MTEWLKCVAVPVLVKANAHARWPKPASLAIRQNCKGFILLFVGFCVYLFIYFLWWLVKRKKETLVAFLSNVASSRVHVANMTFISVRDLLNRPAIRSCYLREDPAYPRAAPSRWRGALALRWAERREQSMFPPPATSICPLALAPGRAQAWSMCDRCALSTKLCGPTRSGSSRLRPPLLKAAPYPGRSMGFPSGRNWC